MFTWIRLILHEAPPKWMSMDLVSLNKRLCWTITTLRVMPSRDTWVLKMMLHHRRCVTCKNGCQGLITKQGMLEWSECVCSVDGARWYLIITSPVWANLEVGFLWFIGSIGTSAPCLPFYITVGPLRVTFWNHTQSCSHEGQTVREIERQRASEREG